MNTDTANRDSGARLVPREMWNRRARALLGLLGAAAKITARAESVLRREGVGLRGREWDLLVTLYVHGPRQAPDLVRRAPIHAAPSSAHAMLGRLHKRGLVDRTVASGPSHAVVWGLTAEGSETVERLYPTLEREVIDQFAEHFSDVELDVIRELTARV